MPFQMFGEQTHTKREELEAVFNENPIGLRGQPFYPLLVGEAPLQEFARANNGALPGPMDSVFMTRYKPGELVLFVVHQVQIGATDQTDATQGNLFLVRLNGDQPHVIGINQNRQGVTYK